MTLRKNTLKIVQVHHLFKLLGRISITGFPTFFSDVAMGILTILFNRQVLRYFGNDALSVYGIIINISTLVQCSAYSIGQAAQPILSINFGAGKGSRIRQVVFHSTITSLIFGLVWMAVCECFPDWIIQIFMKPTNEILQTGEPIIRIYAVSFFLLPLNIFSTYYYQALLKPKDAFIASVGRGLMVSGMMIVLLPMLLGGMALWWSMLVTELVIFLYCLWRTRKHTANLPGQD